jgi:hypothetical protein
VAGSWQGNGMVCVNLFLKRQGNSRGTAGERHGICESVFKTAGKLQGNSRGTAWEQHGNGLWNGMVCVNSPFSVSDVVV